MKREIRFGLIILFSGVCGFTFSLYMHRDMLNTRHQNAQRFEIREYHYPLLLAKQLLHDKAAGVKVYQQYCALCHADKDALPLNAPRIGDQKVWMGLRRLGSKALLQMVIQGKGAMPARGGCFECTDKELHAALRYMLSQH